MKRFVTRFAALAGLVLFVSGCGGDQEDTYEATGTVKIQGLTEIPPGMKLVLTPADGSTMETPSTAEIESNGSFAFMTYEEGDGAPAGKYKVSVSGTGGKIDLSEKAPPKGAAGVMPGQSPVAQKYNSPATSDIPQIEISTDESKNKFNIELEAAAPGSASPLGPQPPGPMPPNTGPPPM